MHRSWSGQPGSCPVIWHQTLIERLVTYESMQAPRRFLQGFCCSRRALVVFKQWLSQELRLAFAKLGRGYITKSRKKKAQSVTLCAFSEN